MVWFVWGQREATFVTFGDAMSSWLDNPDPITINCCLLSMRDLKWKPGRPRRKIPRPLGLESNRYWVSALTRTRRLLTVAILTLASLASCIGFAATIWYLSENTDDSIITAGFGAMNTNMVAIDGESFASPAMAVNTPQLIWSLVFFTYNALFTSMHLAHEYSGYCVHRKSLRVSTPHGQQRRTYWLQLPFTYGIPLIAISATVHWLISQALFLVHVEGSGSDGEVYFASFGLLSPAPALVVLIIIICGMVTAIVMGFRKLQGRSMPVASSCSFALAAAAHRPDGDVDAAVLPVKWGEVISMGNGNVGHCCFTSQEVEDPVSRKKYG